MGDISDQLALKQRLKCKSFQWYMDNVAYDVYDKFPQLPPNLYWGEIRNIATNLCLDAMGNQPPSLMATQMCHGHGNNQLLRLNVAGQLGVGERCVEADTQGVKLSTCRLGTVDGPWSYDINTYTLLHKTHKKCMAINPETRMLALMQCDFNNAYHQWKFKKFQPN